jgi:hypothetical protein
LWSADTFLETEIYLSTDKLRRDLGSIVVISFDYVVVDAVCNGLKDRNATYRKGID